MATGTEVEEPGPGARAVHGPDSYSNRSGWSDSSARALLQLMTESVAEMIGFEVVALSVALDDELVTMAFTGPEELREFMFQPDPITVLDPIVERAETWGRFCFLAAEDHDDDLEGHWAITAPEGTGHPEAWRPLDVLLGVLTDDAGAMVGVLSVDRPLSGRRPDPRQRQLLERYAAQAERALLTAFEREAMIHQIAHAEAARRLIRAASMPTQASVDAVLSQTHLPLVEGFGASGSWVQVLDPRGGGRDHARTRDGQAITLDATVVDLAHRLAPVLWADQQVLVIGEDVELRPPSSYPTDHLLSEARHQLQELHLASVLAVALGAGSECVGFLALTRRDQDPPWSTIEIESAREIGHDLGAALVAARALERERTLVRELEQRDDYRAHLVARLSHELRTPLTVIMSNLEVLGELALEDLARRCQTAMERGTVRMQSLVDDLMLLAQVSHPQHPLVPVPVDLRRTVGDVVALVESTAQAKGLEMRVELGPGELVVPGDPSELDRLLLNLVSNAVKYTPSGGSVVVSVVAGIDQVQLRVADDGLGISEDDQAGLFQVFYRTTNPQAQREPGTGLGLAIVAFVVERHHGTTDVASRLGEGTTFTVTLPRT